MREYRTPGWFFGLVLILSLPFYALGLQGRPCLSRPPCRSAP